MASSKSGRHTETNGDKALDEQVSEEMNALFADPELAALFKGMKEVSVGFPPYFVMEVGKAFRAIPMLLDNRDERFPRYHMKLCMPKLDCQIGPVNNGEIVTVERGGIFTISAYAALPLNGFFGFEIGVLCKSSRPLPITQEDLDEDRVRKLFEFKVLLTPKDELLLKSEKDEDMKTMRDMHKRMRQAAMENMIKNYSTSRVQAAALV